MSCRSVLCAGSERLLQCYGLLARIERLLQRYGLYHHYDTGGLDSVCSCLCQQWWFCVFVACLASSFCCFRACCCSCFVSLSGVAAATVLVIYAVLCALLCASLEGSLLHLGGCFYQQWVKGCSFLFFCCLLGGFVCAIARS